MTKTPAERRGNVPPTVTGRSAPTTEAKRIAAWLKSWVPSGERGCSGYDSACQCLECRERDRKHTEDADATTREEVRAIMHGADPLPEPTHAAPRCHGFANCCQCRKCKARARLPQRAGSCSCTTKYPDTNGHCQSCGRPVRGFFEAEAERAAA